MLLSEHAGGDGHQPPQACLCNARQLTCLWFCEHSSHHIKHISFDRIYKSGVQVAQVRVNIYCIA
eukprot:6192268-Pleurochrysis_carterae.AAC.2